MEQNSCYAKRQPCLLVRNFAYKRTLFSKISHTCPKLHSSLEESRLLAEVRRLHCDWNASQIPGGSQRPEGRRISRRGSHHRHYSQKNSGYREKEKNERNQSGGGREGEGCILCGGVSEPISNQEVERPLLRKQVRLCESCEDAAPGLRGRLGDIATKFEARYGPEGVRAI